MNPASIVKNSVQWEQKNTSNVETIKAREFEMNEPTALIYLGMKEVTTAKGTSYLLNFQHVDDSFQPLKDEYLDVWSCTVLTKELTDIPANTLVRITQLPAPKGKSYLNFKVETGTYN